MTCKTKKQMETRIIARINDVDIVAGDDPKKLVPIKPICEAIGIDIDSQRKKIKEHPILNSVTVLSTATGSDGKQYEMLCIPFEFIFGWLFTINASNVKEESREAVLNYQTECYRALYQYFVEPQTFLQDKQRLMEEKISEYQDCQRRFKDAQKLMLDAKNKLNQVTRVTIDEWRMNNRQMEFSFEATIEE
nr:phage antirepressor N-terminal domain-containing protein [uncultured Bacteroides sp.]